jgi:hypothetical protein
MADQNRAKYSDLVQIARRNGDFHKNYGTLVGALLYLRSISAARGRSMLWGGLFTAALTIGIGWLQRRGWALLSSLPICGDPPA